jgi:hypothetical protein
LYDKNNDVQGHSPAPTGNSTDAALRYQDRDARDQPADFKWHLPSAGHLLYGARDARDDPRRETAEQRTVRWIKEQTAERNRWLKYRTESEANLVQAQQRLEEIDAELTTPLPLPCIAIKQPTFEVDGWDVVFSARATVDAADDLVYPSNSDYIDSQVPVAALWRAWHLNYARFAVRVELKTTLGDDYPAVLRQMKANRGKGSYDRDVLLVDRFTATGASREQIRAIFAASQLTVLGLAAVEAAGESQHE